MRYGIIFKREGHKVGQIVPYTARTKKEAIAYCDKWRELNTKEGHPVTVHVFDRKLPKINGNFQIIY